jgi:hypothetical protein
LEDPGAKSTSVTFLLKSCITVILVSLDLLNILYICGSEKGTQDHIWKLYLFQ